MLITVFRIVARWYKATSSCLARTPRWRRWMLMTSWLLRRSLLGYKKSPFVDTDASQPMDIKELQDTYTWEGTQGFDWLKFFQSVEKFDGEKARGFAELDRVMNVEPEYFEKLMELLKDTDERTLMNYIMSSMLDYAKYLGPDYESIDNDYTYASDIKNVPERKDSCLEKTLKIFPNAVSRMYIEKYFPKESKTEVVELVANLKESFLGLLGDNPWMEGDTKDVAHQKLKKMGAKIGFQDELFDNKSLNKEYKRISAEKTQFFETIVDAQRLATYLNWASLKTPKATKDSWENGYPYDDDASYRTMENELFFPAAFMQDAVYNPGFTKSMKYGRLGFAIGRELTKGFDKTGYKFDQNGKDKDWFTAKDKRKFEDQSKCFVDQYGCFKWQKTPLDGELTLAENIADNGGLKQSYRAYRTLIHRMGVEEARLPGLTEMNHDQIFFLSFAQLMCSKTDDAHMEKQLNTNTFAPKDKRVFGTLQNSDEFTQAYNCPRRSRMNRADKCFLW